MIKGQSGNGGWKLGQRCETFAILSIPRHDRAVASTRGKRSKAWMKVNAVDGVHQITYIEIKMTQIKQKILR